MSIIYTDGAYMCDACYRIVIHVLDCERGFLCAACAAEDDTDDYIETFDDGAEE